MDLVKANPPATAHQRFSVRLLDEEKDAFLDLAGKERMTLSDYLRFRLGLPQLPKQGMRRKQGKNGAKRA